MNKFVVIVPMLLLSRAVLASGLVLEDAWVRALPPTQANTAAYLRIDNRGTSPVQVVGASVELAGSVEIHTSATVDGYVTMQQLPTLTVNPGSSVDLSPGGKHLMLLNLERMPQAGESLQLCLMTNSGEKPCIAAPVVKGSPSNDQIHQHH